MKRSLKLFFLLFLGFFYVISSCETASLDPPKISSSGDLVRFPFEVRFASEMEGITYRYTIDGSEPTLDSLEGLSVTLNEPCTVKVIAVLGVYFSTVVKATFIELESFALVLKPDRREFKVSQQIFLDAQDVVDVVIYYTIDGSEPSEESIRYEKVFEINETTTIRAIGFKNGVKSNILSETFTLVGDGDVVDPPIDPPVSLIETLFVEGGTFTMGADYVMTEPKTQIVTLDSFYMGKYEVTQGQWEAVMGVGVWPSGGVPSFGVGDSFPIHKISWYDAVGFCNALSSKEGLTPSYTGSGDSTVCDFNVNGYRLPTEAEWEYAARGGINKSLFLYSGSDDIEDVAWYSGNNSPDGTKAVGTKAPNALGIYDMSGNVFEWCWDWDGSYSNVPQSNPRGASSGYGRNMRGSGFDFNPPESGLEYCRVACRREWYPSGSYDDFGFRVVRRNASVAMKVATPVITISSGLDAGNFDFSQPITFTSATSGSTFYYTTDGTNPTTLSDTANSINLTNLTISGSCTVKVFAVVANHDDSDVVSLAFTQARVATPTISPAGRPLGASETEVITLACTTAGVAIYYTTDGTPPTAGSTLYDSVNKFSVTGGQTVKAIATKVGYVDSVVAEESFSILSKVVTPVITISSGLDAGDFDFSQQITFTSTTSGATFHYTTNGNDPTTLSSTASSIGLANLGITGTCTVKVLAVMASYDNSDVASLEFSQARVAIPTVDPNGGEFVGSQQVILVCASASAKIHYTVDGSNPTVGSTQYSSAFTVSETTTVKAIAIEVGFENSAIATVTFTATLVFGLNAGGSEYLVTDYIGTATVIDIPSMYNGKLVTAIGDNAFRYCREITTIIIPEGVTTIGIHAFSDADALANITIPDSVITMKNDVFASDFALNNVVIPVGVTTIERSMFWHCEALTSVVFEGSVTTIGDQAFQNCFSLETVLIPATVTSIGGSAFSGCRNLTSVTIPVNVAAIDSAAFFDCHLLNTVTIDSATIAAGITASGSFGSLIVNATTIFIKDTISIFGSYITGNFTLIPSSSKTGYNQYVENSTLVATPTISPNGGALWVVRR